MSVELALEFGGTFFYDHPDAPISSVGKEATARPVDVAKLLEHILFKRFKEIFAKFEIGKATNDGLTDSGLSIAREWKPEKWPDLMKDKRTSLIPTDYKEDHINDYFVKSSYVTE